MVSRPNTTVPIVESVVHNAIVIDVDVARASWGPWFTPGGKFSGGEQVTGERLLPPPPQPARVTIAPSMGKQQRACVRMVRIMTALLGNRNRTGAT